MKPVSIGSFAVGGSNPIALIAGPCVIESPGHAVDLAVALKEIAANCDTPLVFKASFDKANRTSRTSFRGPGLESGLRTLADVKARTGLPILTDIHEPAQAERVAEVADVIQIPAFLSRQTDLLIAAARTGKVVNVKKGQFLAPRDMRHVVAKIAAEGNESILVTERGVSILYITHDLLSARMLADQVIVLNGGRVVEQGPALDVIHHPRDDYTKLLLEAVPNPFAESPAA